MDQKSKPIDCHAAESFDRHLPMPWDELLAAVRRSPQLSAVEAARTVRQRSDLTTDGLSTLPAASPPTWDGLHTAINTLHRKNLLPDDLPHTRSPSVMLTHLLNELALIFTGHRRLGHNHGAASAEPRNEGAQVRFETECITWLITGRLGVRAAATGSLKGYLKHGELIPEFSRDRVLQTVDAIEGLFGGAVAFGTTIREEMPSLFELGDSLAV